tara:strand:+ start:1148 stop:1354 length:207 start_codon:yes stop_codon:yes gene_type:complete
MSNIKTIIYIGIVAGIANVKMVSFTLSKISSVSLSGAKNKYVNPSNINKNRSKPIFSINFLIVIYSFM